MTDHSMDRKDAEIARLRAEVAALRADAERYRWLRENWSTLRTDYIAPNKIRFILGLPKWTDASEDEIDGAIDAARDNKE